MHNCCPRFVILMIRDVQSLWGKNSKIDRSLNLSKLDELVHSTNTEPSLNCKLGVAKGAPLGTPLVLDPPIRFLNCCFHYWRCLRCTAFLLLAWVDTFIKAKPFGNLCQGRGTACGIWCALRCTRDNCFNAITNNHDCMINCSGATVRWRHSSRFVVSEYVVIAANANTHGTKLDPSERFINC